MPLYIPAILNRIEASESKGVLSKSEGTFLIPSPSLFVLNKNNCNNSTQEWEQLSLMSLSIALTLTFRPAGHQVYNAASPSVRICPRCHVNIVSLNILLWIACRVMWRSLLNLSTFLSLLKMCSLMETNRLKWLNFEEG